MRTLCWDWLGFHATKLACVAGAIAAHDPGSVGAASIHDATLAAMSLENATIARDAKQQKDDGSFVRVRPL